MMGAITIIGDCWTLNVPAAASSVLVSLTNQHLIGEMQMSGAAPYQLQCPGIINTKVLIDKLIGSQSVLCNKPISIIDDNGKLNAKVSITRVDDVKCGSINISYNSVLKPGTALQVGLAPCHINLTFSVTGEVDYADATVTGVQTGPRTYTDYEVVTGSMTLAGDADTGNFTVVQSILTADDRKLYAILTGVAP